MDSYQAKGEKNEGSSGSSGANSCSFSMQHSIR